MPATCGPTRIPRTISTTTTGIATRGPTTVTISPATAAVATITRNEAASTPITGCPPYALMGNLRGAAGLTPRSRGLTKPTSRAASASSSLHAPSNSRVARAPVGYLSASSASSGPPLARSRASRSIDGLCPISITDGTASPTRCRRPSSPAAEASYSSDSMRTSGDPPRPGATPSSVCMARMADEHSTSAGSIRCSRMYAAIAFDPRLPRPASGRSWSGRLESFRLDLA